MSNGIIESQAFTFIALAIQGGILKMARDLYVKYREKEEEEEKLVTARDNALRSILRTEIISICAETERDGFIPMHNLDNLNEMYNSYKILGGNGAIPELYRKTLEYPHHERGEEFCSLKE